MLRQRCRLAVGSAKRPALAGTWSQLAVLGASVCLSFNAALHLEIDVIVMQPLIVIHSFTRLKTCIITFIEWTKQ